jgi:alpha-L-fucosidase
MIKVLVVLLTVWSAVFATGANQADKVREAAHVTPTQRQLAWQHDEFTAFIHFGPNTYTGREVGNGKESPSIVDPVKFDPDQWMRAFKDAGIGKVILIAKHHDGMVLWPSRYTKHSIRYSRWRSAYGDIVGDFVKAAHKYGMSVGLYLSPADIHESFPGGTYANGSKPRPAVIPTLVQGDTRKPTHVFHFMLDDYNRYYMNTLYELLTQYGPIQEVWFDGANPTDRAEPYAYQDWYALVRALRPNAVIFNGPDVNWVGNENGVARKTQWSVVAFTTAQSPIPDATTELRDRSAEDVGGRADLLDPRTRQLVWYPAECDARLEATWFWHPNQPPKSLAELQKMYYASVGRNCQLLLDVPPDRDGLLDHADVARLHEFGAWIRNEFGHPVAQAGSAEIRENDPFTFGTVGLQERIEDGQRIERFVVDAQVNGAWQKIAEGTTIGYKRLIKLSHSVTASAVRVRILQSRDVPEIADLAVYK